VTKNNVKSFRVLLSKDGMKISYIAQLVQINGVLFRNRWGTWEAAFPDSPEVNPKIETALNALSDYVTAEADMNSQYLEEYYNSGTHHPFDDFGFQEDDKGNLFIEKTPVQTLEDEVERLKEENKRLGGKYEPSIQKDLVAPELELANQIYREALDRRDPETNKVEGKTPREWMLDRLAKIDNSLGEPTMLRIASVANWDKKQTNKSKK